MLILKAEKLELREGMRLAPGHTVRNSKAGACDKHWEGSFSFQVAET